MVSVAEQLSQLLAEQLNVTAKTVVPVGRFIVGKSPALALEIAKSYAKQNGLLSFDEYIEFHQKEPKKPVKPTGDAIENAFFKNPPPAKNEQERRFFRLAFERAIMSDYFDNLKRYEEEQQNKELFIKSFSPDIRGYIIYISEKSKEVGSFFFDKYKTLPISEESRKRHTYIVGGSGSGKSELMKALFFHYLNRNKSTALVLIEPHGKLSREVSRWRELQGDRLVYIRPGIEGDKVPVFNPFDIDDEQRKSPRVVSVLVDDTIEIVAELLERDFTAYMDTLLRACFYILFSRRKSTFLDVIRFIEPENKEEFIEAGKRIFSPSSPLLSFILNDLWSPSLNPTRQAVKMRFTSLLSRHFISSFLIGKSSFNIDELLQARKFLIFNFSSSDIGATESRIFGKLILAHIKAFGFRQGREEHPPASFVPVHVFVDECQEFITPSIATIIEQLRKFGIHLTLAQQSIGQGMDKELEKAILSNTAVKATGRNSETNIKRFCAETGADPDELKRLEKGRGLFCIQSAGLPPVIIKTPGHRLDSKGGVKNEIWAKTLADQLSNYYTTRKTTINLDPDKKPVETKTDRTQKGTFNVADSTPTFTTDY